VPTTPVLPVDAVALVTSAATALATGGPRRLPVVLADVVSSLGLRSAVLRGPEGSLLAVAGEVVHAVPPRRAATGPEAVVELPVVGGGALTVVGARPSQLPALRGVAAVAGLALAGEADALPLALLAAADEDADDAADALHDGPVQELVVARLAADAAARGGDPATARDAVLAALQSLRRSLWMLRPRGASDGGLAPALRSLGERLLEAGRPGLELDLDDSACGALSPHASAVAYRLVQACARAAGSGGAETAVAVTRSGPDVVVRVDGPLPAPERWHARARALGASLTSGPGGSVLLRLPTARPADEIEASP
jgi:signal transduction histidine kinase